jgi:hypothetical protein
MNSRKEYGRFKYTPHKNQIPVHCIVAGMWGILEFIFKKFLAKLEQCLECCKSECLFCCHIILRLVSVSGSNAQSSGTQVQTFHTNLLPRSSAFKMGQRIYIYISGTLYQSARLYDVTAQNTVMLTLNIQVCHIVCDISAAKMPSHTI